MIAAGRRGVCDRHARGIAPEPLPEEPPEDLGPANPDEDADGILDEQERQAYDAAVAEQQAAETVAEVPQSVDC